MKKTTVRSTKKLDIALNGEIDQLKKPNILEFGVQIGSSTSKFIEICKKKNGKLYSIDIDDCSGLFHNKFWKFIQSMMIPTIILIKEFLQKST